MKDKIVYFALEEIDDSYGGPIRSVSAIAYLLSKNSIEVKIIKANFKFSKNISTLSKKFTVINIWKFLTNLINKNKKEIVVAFNNQWTPAVQLLGLFLTLIGIKFVWFVRGDLELNNIKKTIIWNFSQKFLLRKSIVIVVSSETAKKKVLKDKKITENKVIVVPNILNYKSIVKTNHGDKTELYSKVSQDEEFKIIYIGRIHRKKKIHEILLNINIDDFPSNISIRVAGYVSDSKYLHFIQNIAKQKKIKLLVSTNISENQKYKLLKNSDLFISMSNFENFGISIFESLWVGTPVIINSDIEFWPKSNFSGVTSTKPSELNNVLLDQFDKIKIKGEPFPLEEFKKNWIKMEEKSKSKIVDIFNSL